MEKVYSNEVKEGKNVKIAGFVHDKRDIGKLIFLVVRDREGQLQVTFKKGIVTDEMFESAKRISKESYVSIIGDVAKNERAPMGVEIKPSEFNILSRAESPLPLDISGKIDSTLDKRLDWRFLDVRSPKVMAVFKLQSEIVTLLNEFMINNKFRRIFTSRITGAATEGGTEYFPIMYFNKEAFLAQSPQLYKESALASGLDRVYEIGFVYRAEPHHTTRHLCEYVSFDFEMTAENMDEILDMEEKMMQYIITELNTRCKDVLELYDIKLKAPKKIPRVTLIEANKILAEEGLDKKLIEENDLTPEGERAICAWALKKHKTPFVFITHFPFKKKPFYIMKDGKKSSLSFDLLYNGLEITSGGIREHRYDMRVENIKDKGIDPTSFDHLRFFKYGMPPHGGLAIGIERLTEKILGLENVREATLTPRDPDRLNP
ncbi:aspartate--tRNA(Asn) ligase [archaeon]|nr:aspartate--tRNA(Asn) ligase [archaeon]